MKYAPNIETLIKRIIDAPAKDWSSYLPLVRVSKMDYYNAEILIQRYLKGYTRERAMFSLEEAKKDPKTDYSDFTLDLYRNLILNKPKQTLKKIMDEFGIFFPMPNGIKNHPSISSNLYFEVNFLIHHYKEFKKYQDRYLNHLDALRELDIAEEIKNADPDQLGKLKRHLPTKSYERLINECLEDEKVVIFDEPPLEF